MAEAAKKIDFSPVRALFKKRGKMEAWPKVEALLAPWVRMAETGALPLKPAAEIDAKAYAEAVSKATGKPVSKVVFLSMARTRQAWMDGRIYMSRLGDSLGEIPNLSHRSLWEILWNSLEASFMDRLWGGVKSGFADCRSWTKSEADLKVGVFSNLWPCIYFTVAFALHGDRDNFAIMAALLKTQKNAFGLGFKKHEPDVFLALCA